MTRPEKPIDWEKVDHLLMAGCKGTEIAPHFDMHPDTLYRRIEEKYNVGFTAYCSYKREHGDSLLKVKQYEKALEKDNTMLIWLGKQRLDQREPGLKEMVADQLMMDLQRSLTRVNSYLYSSEPAQASDKEPVKDHTD